MTIQEWGAIGELIGGIAVLITLIYLAIQVRQNTTALHTASRQEIVSSFRGCVRLSCEPGAARKYASGLHSYPNMPFDDRSMFALLINDLALFFQGAFALYESGQLEEETYHAYLNWFACNVATPGGGAWWAEVGRPHFTKRMVEVVDAKLSQGELPDILELQLYHLDDPASPARQAERD